MALCDNCSKTFHWCGSCGTGDDMDEYFCSGQCQALYMNNQKLDILENDLTVIMSNIPIDIKIKLHEIITDNRDTVGNLIINRILRGLTYVPYKERKI